MTINVIKFSQFAAANLTNSSNMVVGVTSPSGGTNFQTPNQNSWTTPNRPSPPYAGLSGYNSSLGQIEYWNGSTWVQLAAGGSGSVNVGAINQLAWYAANGSAVSGLNTANSSLLTTDSGGVPGWSTTLPSGLTIPQPNIVGVTNGSNAAAGSVGEYISLSVAPGDAVAVSSGVATNIGSISLTAGDWDIRGTTIFSNGGATVYAFVNAGFNTVSSTIPGSGLENNQYAYFTQNTGGITYSNCIGPMRLNLTTTTTVYLVAFAQFSVTGTAPVYGFIGARRIR